jgi:PPK2 family polyphosphate:nucleotide phosphotransferase
MFKAVNSPYLVPYDGSFVPSKAATTPPSTAPEKQICKDRLALLSDELSDLQRMLYADNRWSVLLVFQAMDAAGKDSTIRHVLSGVNPAGCQVFSFKRPSEQELDHDFLWRTAACLPERGRIGVFNRSYYEEVLAVKVHPEYLDYQRLPPGCRNQKDFWHNRYESIRDHEKHLARNGTVVLKFWLNVSKEEQKKRFLARIDEPHKNWKFEEGDLQTRKQWGAYMRAYSAIMKETSRSYAPWYAIPADDKPFMRMTVAELIVQNLKQLKLSYPRVDSSRAKALRKIRRLLDD